MQAIAEKSEELYRESLEKLLKFVRRYDPITLLAIVTSYSLSVPISHKGIQKTDSEFALYQSHIEFLQALMLQIEPERLERDVFGPDVVQQTIDALASLMQAQSFRQLPR